MKIGTLTKFTIGTAVFLVLFTIVCLVASFLQIVIPDMLIEKVYQVCGVELMATMLKAIINIKFGGNSNATE